MARTGVTSRRKASFLRRPGVAPALIIVLAVVVVGAVAAFVVSRSDDSSSNEPAASFTDACSVLGSSVISDAVSYQVGVGVPVANLPPVSGCAYAATDLTSPAVGVITTDDAQSSDLFNRETLQGTYTTVESVNGLGKDAFYVSRDTDPETVEGLLVVTNGKNGVEVAINGKVTSDKALDLAKKVAEQYVSRLGL